MANNELLYQTLDQVIAANAEGRWNQKVWCDDKDDDGEFCGTAGCFAGWRAIMDGYTLIAHDNDGWVNGLSHENGGRLYCWGFNGIDTIADYAEYRLGLTDREAEALFKEDNDLDDIKQIVDQIATGTFDQDEWL